MRVTTDEMGLLRRAAEIEHLSRIEFVRKSAFAAAAKATRRHEVMPLSTDDCAAFVEALMHPPPPGERLRAAARAHRELIGG